METGHCERKHTDQLQTRKSKLPALNRHETFRIPPLRETGQMRREREKGVKKEEEKGNKRGLTLTSAFLLSRLLAAVDGERGKANISSLGQEQQSTLQER